jgi:hypothetical protein
MNQVIGKVPDPRLTVWDSADFRWKSLILLLF